MLGAAGLRAPAKRTAFGDASNAINIQRSTKDDAMLPLKQGGLLSDKPISVLADKKANVPRKQLSRPYSVSNLRGLLTGNNNNAKLEQPIKPVPLDQGIQAKYRKPVTKEPATKVYTDALPPAVRHDQPQSLIAKPITDIVAPSIPIASTATNPQLPAVSTSVLANPIVTKSQPTSNINQDVVHPILVQSTNQSSDPIDAATLRSDGIFIDDQGNIRVYHGEPAEHEQPNLRAEPVPRAAQPVTSMPQYYGIYPHTVAPSVYPSVAGSTYENSNGQPEECWDDEDEENYDEEGYVTARSFRSRGDTTGGVTTILFPQVNQQATREIEAAKLQADAERSLEDIEDEHLDTSMVAEYGDEIFEYMRELEVSIFLSMPFTANRVTRSRCCPMLTTWTTRPS